MFLLVVFSKYEEPSRRKILMRAMFNVTPAGIAVAKTYSRSKTGTALVSVVV